MENTPVVQNTDEIKNLYRGEALSQMRILKQEMALGCLSIGRRTTELWDGVIIDCVKCFNREDIYITIPKEVGEVAGEIPVVTSFVLFEETGIATNQIYISFTAVVPGSFPARTSGSVDTSLLYPELSDLEMLIMITGISGSSDFGQSLLVKYHDKMTFVKPGSVIPIRTITYITAIRSDNTHLAFYTSFFVTKNTGNQFGILNYLNSDYGTQQVKLLLLNSPGSITPAFEADYDVHPVLVLRETSINDFEANRNKNDLICYIHNGTTHSGNFYNLIRSGDTLGFTDFGLPSLPDGNYSLLSDTVNWKYEEEIYRVFFPFTLSLWTLSVKTSLSPLLNDTYGFETFIFPAMTCSADKRDLATKVSLSNYNLDSTTVDTVFQGVPNAFIATAAFRFHGSYTGAIPGFLTPFTRFMPVGGTVLVKDNIEYPIAFGYMITEGTLLGSLGLLQQPTILWINGTADETMYTWSGVAAVGLSITKEMVSLEQIPFVPDLGEDSTYSVRKRPLSWMKKIGNFESDNHVLLLQLFPTVPLVGGDTCVSKAQQIIRVKVEGITPVVTLLYYSDASKRISFGGA